MNTVQSLGPTLLIIAAVWAVLKIVHVLVGLHEGPPILVGLLMIFISANLNLQWIPVILGVVLWTALWIRAERRYDRRNLMKKG